MAYTAIQAARFSGCSSAQLDAWRRTGLVVPSEADAHPTAPYTFRDLVALRMVMSLLDAGLPMTRVRRAVGALVGAGHDLAALSLVSDGESVWACRDDGEILDALHHGQLALFVAVGRFADAVDAEVKSFDSDRGAFVESLGGRAAHPARGGSTPGERSAPRG